MTANAKRKPEAWEWIVLALAITLVLYGAFAVVLPRQRLAQKTSEEELVLQQFRVDAQAALNVAEGLRTFNAADRHAYWQERIQRHLEDARRANEYAKKYLDAGATGRIVDEELARSKEALDKIEALKSPHFEDYSKYAKAVSEAAQALESFQRAWPEDKLPPFQQTLSTGLAGFEQVRAAWERLVKVEDVSRTDAASMWASALDQLERARAILFSQVAR